MKFELTDYQEGATDKTVRHLNQAASTYTEDGDYSAVSLSAPTGSGKTVIAAAVIERLIHGDDHVDPRPGTTVLWVTDDPSLNEQTRRKMTVASDRLLPDQLATIDEQFDQPTLDPGTVYFLNIQKLGKGATRFVAKSDQRQHPLWDTIAETVRTRGSDLLLIIDEAHRGTAARTKSNGRASIVSTLLHGGDTHPPAPVALGLSATPKRFEDAVNGQRTLHPVRVDVKEVRRSGLIKDLIRIKNPIEREPSDATLLAAAARDLNVYTEQWAELAAQQDSGQVQPALVVQVPAKVGDERLNDILKSVDEGLGSPLPEMAVAHAFQQHSALNLGSREVRYLAPQDVQDDPHVRVVLFKEALTTGWDCPRAEVMVSLRSAEDHTYIAQLIGRMVRTPMARRVGNELLNSVALYLPGFESGSVAKVIDTLSDGDDVVSSKVEVDPLVCLRNDKVPQDVWDVAEQLPTYTRPSKNHHSQVARLNKLATLLEGNNLRADAEDAARQQVVDTFAREHKQRRKNIDARVEELGALDVTEQVFSPLSGEKKETTVDTLSLSYRNVDDRYKDAKRKLGDAAGHDYWEKLRDDGTDTQKAKLTVVALAELTEVREAVEHAAAERVAQWLKEYHAAITGLTAEERTKFDHIRKLSKHPERTQVQLPSNIIVAADKGWRRQHLYADDNGDYPTRKTDQRPNTWEERVLDCELEQDSTVAWYRNPTGGDLAVGVPYGEGQTMYPDFVVFQRRAGIKADIIDPHDPSRSDTAPKWAGLATFAIEHADQLGRVLAVITDKENTLLSLDLRSEEVGRRLRAATSEDDIRAIFAEHGGTYCPNS